MGNMPLPPPGEVIFRRDSAPDGGIAPPLVSQKILSQPLEKMLYKPRPWLPQRLYISLCLISHKKKTNLF